jgi:2-keto-4-pentenoate hydratase/2-oxohepta-3-ene-1,7-dioic acid hydratase in catechol pathway
MSLYCIGRNYAAHAREMGAAVVKDAEIVVFLKPTSAIVAPPGPVRLPAGATEIHHEAEVVVRVGAGATAEALALGLDLTDRPRQAAAKQAGLPWARAKGFRHSAPLGPFVPVGSVPALDRIHFSLTIDGAVRQRGDTSLLLHSIPTLLKDLDAWFGLVPGDLVFTGTPEGVGPIRSGQVLTLEMDGVPAASASFRVA